MGEVSYFYYVGGGRNAKKPYHVVENASGWLRTLASRGLKPEYEFYKRPMVAEEERGAASVSRHMAWGYESIEDLLQDEELVLADDPGLYKELEAALRKHRPGEDTIMAKAAGKKKTFHQENMQRTALRDRFLQLSEEKRQEIAQWEDDGWNIFLSENDAWNAQHPELAPDWMPQYGSLDPLLVHIAKVAAGGPLNLNDEIPVAAERLGQKGDIARSVSVSLLVDKGAINKPFKYGGLEFVGTAAASGGSDHGWSYVEAYEVVPEKDFQGKILKYGELDREQPGGYWHGFGVTRGGEKFVLQGPQRTFTEQKLVLNVPVEESHEMHTNGEAGIVSHDPGTGKTKIEMVDLEMVPGVTGLIDVNLIDVSPFEAQARRRAHFKDEDLDELGRSIISTKGFVHAPVARQVGGRVQIVAGERRYLAAKRAGYAKVEVKIAILTDEEVREIQLIENLQRQELHPVDEGFDYQDLMKLKGWDASELALQMGKSPDYVANRIKLTGLIEEIRNDIDAGILPLGHGLEIAKFPDHAVQKEIYEDCVFDGWSDDKDMVRPLKDMISEINSQITLKLSKAPFDITATNLRDDGLACVECLDRTGASPGLFAEYSAGKDDSCLRKNCFEGKKERLVQLTRERVAVDQGVDLADVPMYNPHAAGVAGILGAVEVSVVDAKNAGTAGVIPAVSIEPANYGKVIYVKKKQEKKAKGPGGKVPAGSIGNMPVKSEKSPYELAQFYKRKEEIWNCTVAEAVRKRVLAIAAGKFAQTFVVTGGGETFVAAMSAKLWELYQSDYIKKRICYDVAAPIIASHMDLKTVDFSTGGIGREGKIAQLSDDVQKRLLYLLIHGHKGDVSQQRWYSQAPIKNIADEWGIDYRQIDAQVRVDLSAKKHKAAHDDYLKAVESNQKDPKVPRLYSDEWTGD